jgi:hypothetical protein
VKKIFLFVLTVLLVSCSYKFREKNELAIPPLFREEYAKSLEETRQGNTKTQNIKKQSNGN